MSEDTIDRALRSISPFAVSLNEDTARVLQILALFARGETQVPIELWEPLRAAESRKADGSWLPWLAGNFGVGSVCRPRGASSADEAKCVGIRTGRIILEFADGSTAALVPQSVEGRVD